MANNQLKQLLEYTNILDEVNKVLDDAGIEHSGFSIYDTAERVKMLYEQLQSTQKILKKKIIQHNKS